MTSIRRPSLGIYYEHPEWFRPLFAELARRGVPFERIHADGHWFDPGASVTLPDVVLNRMSPSAHTRGRAHLIFYTLQYLQDLERRGVRVINGTRAWRTEISKAYQATLFEHLGLPYPRTRVINHPSQAADAAAGLRFPVVVKPDVGGSGAGIRRFDSEAALRDAARSGPLDLGIDSTALVQEFIPAADGHIVRVEVLNGRYLYAIRVSTDGANFNLCPADICLDGETGEAVGPACPAEAPAKGVRVEAYTPPQGIVEAAQAITAAGGIEVGGVEYVVDSRDGRALFYDVNALSNFVADAPRVLGFDPFVRLADWLESVCNSAGQRTDSGRSARVGPVRTDTAPAGIPAPPAEVA